MDTLIRKVIKDIRALIEDKNIPELKNILSELDSFVISDVIEILEPEKQVIVYRLLPKDLALEVFEHIEVDVQQDLLQNFTDQKAIEIFSQLEPDDRIRLVDEMPASVADKLIASLSVKEREMTSLLMGYDIGTAGHIMTPKYVKIKSDMTVKDALEKTRNVGKNIEALYSLYVTDSARKLKGVVTLRDLVLADPATTIQDIMDDNPTTVYTDTEDENVARLLQESDLIALPVVDKENRLVGVITVDDAIDIITDEANEAAFDKVGLVELNQRESDRSKVLISGPLWKVWRIRIPFLLITLVGGMLAGLLIEQFEDALTAVTAVAFFLPVVMDMGGNVGTQSSTIFSRALALGQIRFTRFLKQLFREIAIGVSMGIILGILGTIIAALWQGSIELGIVVGLSLTLTITIATCLGYVVPYILAKLGFDQAAGADPIITTIKDISGLLIYFLLVTAFLWS